MNRCPVCRTRVASRTASCTECGTPLGFSSGSGYALARRSTPFLPGLGHLWLGHLVSGFFALFGSGIAFLLLLRGPIDPVRVLLLGVFWVIWAGGWTLHVNAIRRRYPTVPEVVSFFVVVLVVSNLVMFFLLMYIVLSALFS